MNFGGNILLALITSFRVCGVWRTMLLLLLLHWLQWIHLRFVENGNWSNFPLIIRILLFIYAIVIAVANELSLEREKTNSWYNSFHFVCFYYMFSLWSHYESMFSPMNSRCPNFCELPNSWPFSVLLHFIFSCECDATNFWLLSDIKMFCFRVCGRWKRNHHKLSTQ